MSNEISNKYDSSRSFCKPLQLPVYVCGAGKCEDDGEGGQNSLGLVNNANLAPVSV